METPEMNQEMIKTIIYFLPHDFNAVYNTFSASLVQLINKEFKSFYHY